jgi:hypothetical protein
MGIEFVCCPFSFSLSLSLSLSSPDSWIREPIIKINRSFERDAIVLQMLGRARKTRMQAGETKRGSGESKGGREGKVLLLGKLDKKGDRAIR